MFAKPLIRSALNGDGTSGSRNMPRGAVAEILGEVILPEKPGKAMELSAYQTISSAEAAAILPRVASADKTAVKNCIDVYGNLAWALARKYTDSNKEAEAATERVGA